MRKPLLFLFTILATAAIGQTTIADFENISLDPESFNNGSDLSGGFTSGEVFFPNDYFPDDFFWLGWSVSNTTDVTTPGFTNQYSAITGSGFNSSNYGVFFQSFITGDWIVTFDQETILDGFYITNSTYAYLSMLEGDAFAKQFGGLTGNDPDFFLLTISAYNNGELSEESVEFFLADYTFEDNSQDYIVDEWTFVDLSSLGSADSLSFALTSSDNGEFGMNTPAYFCVDDFTTSGPLSINNQNDFEFSVYPNPSTDWLRISSERTPDQVTIYDLNGRPVLQAIQKSILDIRNLQVGTYILQLTSGGDTSSHVFVKL